VTNGKLIYNSFYKTPQGASHPLSVNCQLILVVTPKTLFATTTTYKASMHKCFTLLANVSTM